MAKAAGLGQQGGSEKASKASRKPK